MNLLKKKIESKHIEKKKLDLKMMSKRDIIGRATLCYIFQKDKVLLQLKNPKKFGGGMWNAPGGKLKEGETPEQGVKREILEETGLKIVSPNLRGKLFFVFEKNSNYDQEVFVFDAKNIAGKEKANEEGMLKWFNMRKIPMDKMWPDDKYWLPLLLEGKQFTASFYFDSYENQKITKYKVEEIQRVEEIHLGISSALR